MSENNSGSLVEAWDDAEFRRMQDDGVETYTIEFADGTRRETTFTAFAYFARLDPEANVVDES